MRAAWITLLIALVGVGVLLAVMKITGAGQPTLIDSSTISTAEEGIKHTRENGYEVYPSDELIPNSEKFNQDREYIDAIFPVISDWQLESIQPFFAKATLMQSRNGENFNEVLDTLENNLGELHAYAEPVPGSKLISNANTANYLLNDNLVEYEFTALFEKGLAQVSMVLEDSQGMNSLYAFRIDVIN